MMINLKSRNLFGVVLICIFTCVKLASAQDLNFSNEEGKRRILRKKSLSKGGQYNPYEAEKELIFEQLKIITGDEETRYVIVPGDTLTISYMDRGLRKGAIYKVSGKGKIHVTMVGPVKVGGLNRKKLRDLMNELYGQYIRYPNIDVKINTSGRVMLVGEVRRPGLFFVRPNMTLMELILAGGSYNKNTANLKSVMLMRGGLDNPLVKRLNLLKMIRKGDRTDNVHVKPGDLVYVPKSFISNLNKFKDTVYEYITTYYGFGRLPAPPIKVDKEIYIYGE